MFQGRPLDPSGGVQVFLGLLGRHDHLVQGQGLFLQDDDQVIDRLAHTERPYVSRITQAFGFHPVGAGLHGRQDETALGVRDGPQVVLVQVHDGAGQRFPLRIRHAPAYTETGCKHLDACSQHEQNAQESFHTDYKDTIFSPQSAIPTNGELDAGKHAAEENRRVRIASSDDVHERMVGVEGDLRLRRGLLGHFHSCNRGRLGTPFS